MKADRNQVQSYDIERYKEWITNLPINLICDVREWLRLRHIGDYLSLRKYKSHLRFESIRNDKEKALSFDYDKYNGFYEKMLLLVKQEMLAHDKTEQLFTFMLVLGLIGKKDIEYLQAGGKCDYKLYIDKIIESSILKNTDSAKDLVETFFEVSKDKFLSDNRVLFVSEERRKEEKIQEYENTDFPVLEYLKDGLIYTPVFADDNIKCCQEIGELLFYKFLVSDEVQAESIDEAQAESIKLNNLTQREKLDKLKEIGVFDLDFFSVDPRGNGASQREQARFLASIIGGHEANIRKYLYNMRKEK